MQCESLDDEEDKYFSGEDVESEEDKESYVIYENKNKSKERVVGHNLVYDYD